MNTKPKISRLRSKQTGRFIAPGLMGQIQSSNKVVYKPLTLESFEQAIKDLTNNGK